MHSDALKSIQIYSNSFKSIQSKLISSIPWTSFQINPESSESIHMNEQQCTCSQIRSNQSKRIYIYLKQFKSNQILSNAMESILFKCILI